MVELENSSQSLEQSKFLVRSSCNYGPCLFFLRNSIKYAFLFVGLLCFIWLIVFLNTLPTNSLVPISYFCNKSWPLGPFYKSSHEMKSHIVSPIPFLGTPLQCFFFFPPSRFSLLLFPLPHSGHFFSVHGPDSSDAHSWIPSFKHNQILFQSITEISALSRIFLRLLESSFSFYPQFLQCFETFWVKCGSTICD